MKDVLLVHSGCPSCLLLGILSTKCIAPPLSLSSPEGTRFCSTDLGFRGVCAAVSPLNARGQQNQHIFSSGCFSVFFSSSKGRTLDGSKG